MTDQLRDVPEPIAERARVIIQLAENTDAIRVADILAPWVRDDPETFVQVMIAIALMAGYEDGWGDSSEANSPQRMVRDFHEAFGLVVDAEDTPELRQFRFKLIREEFEEVDEALYPFPGGAFKPPPLEHVAKELADLAYVLYGTAVSLGIDLDEALRRVHASNMSKLGDDGHALRREDGKILKGPNYQPPDMTGVVK